ncbi:PHP domain-containing protein [Thorsellia kenyensis]|uniref:PHP domain-containing protein n=1 Tax=Thorsellia kenyensis TaxID=1549888 RepID=A0ABV6C9V2_9GAMM
MIKNTLFDLHSHTTASDGRLSPEELIERAVAHRIDYLAITDHDCIKAIPFAQKKIESESLPIRLISGVEISTKWLSHDIHVVGLNIDIQNADLEALLASQDEKRHTRAVAIDKKLEKIDVFNSLETILKELKGDSADIARFMPMITRNHFAQHLYKINKVKSHQKAFDKYLAKGNVGYVSAQWCAIETAIEVVHKAGGYAVLAHPYAYPLKGKWARKLIEEFKSMGGDAIEVANSQLTPDRRTHFAKLAQEFELDVSIGSDFHRPTPWSDLGKNLWLPANVSPIWRRWGLMD